ncbi:hypothetical protein B9Z65_8305 [Elsinoe australis]|uniref:FAD-binding PCMH-type domain-containing protein n=1 Tax=Elsinoe australis TaxID=40998 RepID=A0A2P7YDC8_9PEZI|nr:hypothetical protein B9Z65_8305 [Elsinoe australis]
MKLHQIIISLSASLAITHVHAAPSIPVCKQLGQKFPKITYAAGSTQYSSSVNLVWSETCVSTPYCIFEPTSTSQLADGLAIITGANARFAVRGVGHMPVPLANGINNGVLISTIKFRQKTLVAGNSVLQLGPGQPWHDVYEYLSPYGLAVPGGRYSTVGVGGLLLGGGINFFGSQVGFSFSSVINYEVVLANSTIVNANATKNADLFWALKGGSNNFGIVTRFDIKTLPVAQVYGGDTVYPQEQLNNFLSAASAFIAPNGGSYDEKVAINPNIVLDPSTGSVTGALQSFHNSADPAPAALAGFAAIPSTSTTNKVRSSFAAFTNDTNTALYGGPGTRRLFASTAIKVSNDTIGLLNRTFTDSVSSQLTALSNKAGSSITLAMQPITKSWLQKARDAGGDAIDLDPAGGPFITALITALWESPDDDALINQIANDFITRLDKASKAAGLDYSFRYMNDAARGEAIYPLYGNGKSLPKLQKIQKLYDPKNILGRLLTTGFKL